ncbi:MAG: hypothetical protein FWF52_05285 [Candidatus Azobacteroides sp.]|nr:hypothetical protein [Candidatus Azobacteroides sp.]
MANEIVKMVAKKANLSEPIAQIAVDTVLNLLKDKLPPVVGSTLDSFLSSNNTTNKTTTSKTNSKDDDSLLGGLGNITDILGGLLGGKK